MDNSFETIEKVCVKTFGPNGVAALVQGPTGSMALTRRGWAVVQSIYEESNLKSSAMKVFYNSMKEINKTLGDGVKSFALIEIMFLKKLIDMKIGNMMSDATIVQELQRLLRAVCDMEIFSSITVSLSKKEDRVKATSALFCTSCPPGISSNLQNIFHDWVSSSLSTNSCKLSEEHLISNLQFLFKNFDLLCFRNNSGSRCLSDSYTLPGYLIDRIPLNFNNTKEEQVNVELFIPEAEIDVLDILFRIKCMINEKSSEQTLRTLLLTTAFLSEAILFELKQHNFVVLHGVSIEDAEFVSLILHQYRDLLNNTVTVKIYVTGTKECTCLLLPNVFQLLICAPTDSLICEYAYICKNALVHLLVVARCLYDKKLVEAGGIFEKTIHLHIAKQMSKVGDPSLFLVSNRKELLQWHKQYQLMKSKSTKGYCRDVSVRKASVQKDLNNSEDSFVHIVSEENNCLSNLQSIEYTNLSEGRKGQRSEPLPYIQNIGKSNLEINGLLVQDVSENILSTFAQSLLRICNPLSTTVTEAYEPVSFKIQLLHHVIATAILFFKCDITR